MKLTVTQLAERIGAELIGNSNDFDRQICSVGTIEAAEDSDVTFLASDKYRAALGRTRAGAVIVSSGIDGFDRPQLIVKNVNSALIQVLNIFAPRLEAPAKGIDPTAKLAGSVKIAEDVSIGANAVIDEGVEIGKNSVIGSGCKIGQNSKLGENCRLDSNVVVYHNCLLGNNVIIQANSTIGSTGFGYAYIDGAHRLIPHNGGVLIEDFVEIGANCCVDRAKFGNTIIGAGTKIDNLVQIAHNVIIGKCCLIAAQSGISGSTKLGDNVVLGGQVGLADNIEVGQGTIVGAQSGVISDVPAGRRLMGTPALEGTDTMRLIGTMKRLPKMAEQLRQIYKRLEKLEAAKDHKA